MHRCDRFIFFVGIFCFLAIGFFERSNASTYTWTGANDDNWDNSANWSPIGFPIDGDTAIFSNSNSVSVFPKTGTPLEVIVTHLEFNGIPPSSHIGPIEASVGGFFLNDFNSGGTVTNFAGENNIYGTTTFIGSTGFLISANTGSSLVFSGTSNIPLLPSNITLSIGDMPLTISGLGTIEFAGLNYWFNPGGPALNINGVLKVSALDALGESSPPIPFIGPPSSIVMSNGTLMIGVNNFAIATIPITLNLNAFETFNTNGLNASIASVISGSGDLWKQGTGTLSLTGVNTYTGVTDIKQGTLNISLDHNLGPPPPSSSTLTIQDGATLQAGSSFSLSTTRSVGLNGGTATIDTQANSLTIGGQITGLGLLNKLGSGTLVLSSVANNYSGGTTVNGGILQGSASSIQGNITTVGGTTVDFVQPGAGTYGGIMSGAGALHKNGVGTLTLSGANTYTGGTTVNGGILQGPALSIQGNINTVGGTTVDFVQPGAGTYGGIMSGAGALHKNGVGTLTLSGANTYTGGTAVNGGILQGPASSIQGNITTVGGTTVDFVQPVAGTYGGIMSGAGVLQKNGVGTLTLSGANTYSGGSTVNGGILQGTTTSLQGTFTTAANTSVAFNQSGNGSFGGGSNAINGSGSLIKLGSGTVTLTGVNGYSGGTVINGGILSVGSDTYLGHASGSLTFGTGTLQYTSGITSARSITLNGSGSIDTEANTVTLSGPITGPGSLTKLSGGTLVLTGSNSYLGLTTIEGGVLQGNTTSLPGDILVDAGANVTFNQPSAGTFSGIVSGQGSLTKTGATLVLDGANVYSGGTTINSGVLQGTTTSLQGAMTLSGGATLIFSQSSSGTYGEVIAGPVGSFLTMQGGGSFTVTGSSPSFFGTTTVSGNSQLIMMGSLLNSPLTINAGSSLKGTGTVGPTINAGQVIPGTSPGTLFVNGDFSFLPGGVLVTQMTPSENNLLAVSGTATLTSGTLIIQMAPGFYGFNGTRTILTAGSVVGPFSSNQLDPRIEGSLVYNSTNVQLIFQVLRPFLNFPYANANEKAVGENLDAIVSSHGASSDLFSVIDSLAGLSIPLINDALDQMHPAALSAFAELQTELGGQLLSLFHRRPQLACSCSNPSRLWVEPYGNWLNEKKQGMEIGFNATTRGVAIGYDYQFMGCWTLGIGGAYNMTDLKWSLDRGLAYIEGAYGAFYSDLSLGNFFLGASVYAGKDWYDTMRQMHFSTIDRQAKSHSQGLDIGGQITTAYFFGSPSCLLYPYGTVDYLSLQNGSFKERNANSLNLDVDAYTSSTLRAEAGGAIRFVDRNRDATICISPLISMGYVLELPLHRDHYKSTFSGTTIPFTTQGWDMAWQLLNLRFGLGITYRCFTLDSEYAADISPEGNSPFVNQRANFRMSLVF